MKYYRYKPNGQIVACRDLNSGKVCSSGTVVKQGNQNCGEPRPVGYHSDAWVNFESPNWEPVP